MSTLPGQELFETKLDKTGIAIIFQSPVKSNNAIILFYTKKYVNPAEVATFHEWICVLLDFSSSF